MRLKTNLLALLFPLLASAQLSTNAGMLSEWFRKSSETPYVGNRNGVPNPFEEEFKKQSEAFSEDDLFYMGQNGNAVLKVTASKQLVSRKSGKLRALFSEYLSSPEKFTAHTGHLSYDSNAAIQLYKDIAWQKEKAERKKYYDRTITKNEVREMKELFGEDYDTHWTIRETDSLMAAFTEMALANDNVASETLNQIFRLSQFHNTNYARVKYFASKYPSPEILATLANFKDKSDLPLLHRNIDKAYLAISCNPDPSFLPELKRKLATDYAKPEFQEAVTAYCNTESKTLLDLICKKIKTVHPEKFAKNESLFQLYSIIEKKNSRLYDTLLLKIEKI